MGVFGHRATGRIGNPARRVAAAVRGSGMRRRGWAAATGWLRSAVARRDVRAARGDTADGTRRGPLRARRQARGGAASQRLAGYRGGTTVAEDSQAAITGMPAPPVADRPPAPAAPTGGG